MIIIGGGVAGIAAALPLADAGFYVQLLEKRPLLGGRASSHIDISTGNYIDECQHGTMRCCTNLTSLLTRLGVVDQIRYHDAIRFLDGAGRRSVIKGCGLPAPLHTSFSFLTFRSLSLADKICIGRAMLAMVMLRPDPCWETQTIASWFQKTGQTELAIKRFWAPILVSSCNETIDRISCAHAFKIFRDGFLMNHEAFHFGVPRVPLGQLYSQPAVEYIEARGGAVKLKATVDTIEYEAGQTQLLTGITLQNGERMQADYYIAALQSDLLLKLMPQELTRGDGYWERMRAIELSPIIGVHLWFDRILDCPEALATLDRETEWIFNKNLSFDRPTGEPTYLSAVISATHRYVSTPIDQILAKVLEDVRDALPSAREAVLVRSQVIKWPKATFSPLPGVESCRPDQRSPISNLFVAGEWTQTGWPSTMESAAISGYRTAEYILQAEGIPGKLQAAPLPVGSLARLLDSRFSG